MKGNVLARYCDGQDVDKGICIGYVSGVADSISASVCIPPDVETGQLVKTTINYMNRNPALLHHDAAPIVVAALEEGFPCGGD